MCKYNLLEDEEVMSIIKEAETKAKEWQERFSIPNFEMFKTLFEYIGDDDTLKSTAYSKLICTSMPKGKDGKTYFVFSVKHDNGYNHLHDIIIPEDDFSNSIKIVG